MTLSSVDAKGGREGGKKGERGEEKEREKAHLKGDNL